MEALPAGFIPMVETAQMTASLRMAYSPLVGTEDATVDDKGRLRLSQKKQDRLGMKFVAYQNPLGCLVLFPSAVWEERLAEMLAKPAGDLDRVIATRQSGAMAEDDMRCDAQGRFVIPQRFRDDLQLKGDVVVVGGVDRVEIWPKKAHQKFAADVKAKAEEMREMAINATVNSQLL